MINSSSFTNSFRPSQLAESTERMLNEIVELTSKTHPTHNAALSGERRYHGTKPYHRKHKTQRWNEKCQALGIRLKAFVITTLSLLPTLYDLQLIR
ncbi:hypothetical protein VAEKB19_4650001 [Vibrio aestuarianus]|nr:hypothetical protein VAEKB19_4650001 [Vibrio aestuarianus]